MIQRNPILDFISHAILILGVVVVFFPIYVTFIGSDFDPLRGGRDWLAAMPSPKATHLLRHAPEP